MISFHKHLALYDLSHDVHFKLSTNHDVLCCATQLYKIVILMEDTFFPFSTIIHETTSEKIHVNGCMDVIRGVLFKHGMPTLLVCALVSLVVALIELLLLLCAACFADHIRKAAKHRSLLFSPNQVCLYELKITITSL